MVGVRGVASLVRVVADGWQTAVGDGADVADLVDEVVAGEDVVDQLWLALIYAGESGGFGDEWGEVP